MSASFTRVSQFQRGYAPDEVDEYLAQAKRAYAAEKDDFDAPATVSFRLVAGGYAPEAVDAALDRLQAAIIKRRRAAAVSAQGEQSWLDCTQKQAQTLMGRLHRPARARFAQARRRGYEMDAVDAFLDSVREHFEGGAAEITLSAATVAGAMFPEAKKENAYNMQAVDSFLDRLFEVLAAVE